jgi:hypothetical protein
MIYKIKSNPFICILSTPLLRYLDQLRPNKNRILTNDISLIHFKSLILYVIHSLCSEPLCDGNTTSLHF